MPLTGERHAPTDLLSTLIPDGHHGSGLRLTGGEPAKRRHQRPVDQADRARQPDMVGRITKHVSAELGHPTLMAPASELADSEAIAPSPRGSCSDAASMVLQRRS